jgi:hypothetical protein
VITGTVVQAQSGISTPHLARAVGLAGLCGLEHIVGIPGTLGGLLHEWREPAAPSVIRWWKSRRWTGRGACKRWAATSGFAYRHSRFQEHRASFGRRWLVPGRRTPSRQKCWTSENAAGSSADVAELRLSVQERPQAWASADGQDHRKCRPKGRCGGTRWSVNGMRTSSSIELPGPKTCCAIGSCRSESSSNRRLECEVNSWNRQGDPPRGRDR